MGTILCDPIEMRSNNDPEELANIIRAVYKQVLGNAHILESERLTSAESQLCDGNFTVKDFVRAVAKSDLYRSLYFESCPPYRFVELNFKHLLGRAPMDQSEIAEHVRIYNEEGYEAEIDSYIDSVEYENKFGDNIAPYYQGAKTQTGFKQVTYSRTLSLFRGNAEFDSATKNSRLVEEVATNAASAIKPPSSGGRLVASKDATEKTFKIVVKGSTAGMLCRRSNQEYVVSGGQMNSQIQMIKNTKGKIVSITEVA